MSLRSAIYLPRTAEVRVEVDVPGMEARLGLVLRVKSVSMVDRGPTYVIGGQFVDLSAEGQAGVDLLMAGLRAQGGERRERLGA